MTESADPDADATESEARVQEMAVALMVSMQDDKGKLFKHVRKLSSTRELGRRVFTTLVDGWTPFHAAVLRGSKKLLKLMLNTGMDVNQRMGEPNGLPAKCTALHIAAHRGDTKIIEYLLSRGAHINLKGSSGRPPLYYAASSNHMDAVEILLTYGADISGSGVNVCDKDLRPLPRLQRPFSIVKDNSS